MKLPSPRHPHYLQFNRGKFAKICPAHMAETDFEDGRLEPCREAINRALNWGKDELSRNELPATGFLISGETGRGKTRALWAVLRRLMCEEGIDCAPYQGSAFASLLRSQVRFGDESGVANLIGHIARIPVLAIDDFGQEADKDGNFPAWLLQLLDQRMAAGLPLFLTTNLTSAMLLEKYGPMRGPPLLRRLLEMCEVIKF